MFTIFVSLAYISNSVSDGATNKSVLNIEKGDSMINSAKEYEPDVWNTLCATQA